MDLAKELDLNYNMVYAENITEVKLLNIIISLKEKCEKILSFVTIYDFDEQHPYNGYRSAVLFVINFFASVHSTKLDPDFESTIEEVIIVCNALNQTLQSIIEFHQDSLNYHNYSLETLNKNKLENSEKNFSQLLQLPIDNKILNNAFDSMQDNHIPFIFNKYYEFYYKTTNKNINETLLSNLIKNFDLWSWFKTITSSTLNSTSSILNSMQINSVSSNFPGSQLNSVMNWFFGSNSKPYILETITIDRQLEWLICPITFEIKHNPMKFQLLNHREKSLTFRLIRNTVNSSGHILIYIFSPDYFNSQVDINNSFLNDWSTKLPGCSILVPEFSVSLEEKFPLHLQDCLDIYLWIIGQTSSLTKDFSLENNSSKKTHSRTPSASLSSYFTNGILSNNTLINKNNQQVLGRAPESIILTGDSLGGNLATSLMLVLNDIRKKFNINIKIPQALVLAYAPFNLRDYSPIMLTSRFNYSISPIIALTVVESNLPLPKIENFVQTKSKNKNLRKQNCISIEKEVKESNSETQLNKKIKKTNNNLNNFFIEKFNKTKLSDFFFLFQNLNKNDLEDNLSCNSENEYSEQDTIGNEDEKLDFSYFSKALYNYLFQYNFNYKDTKETENEIHLSKSNNTLNSKDKFIKFENFNFNQKLENESLFQYIFTLFKFFNNEKKNDKKELNFEILKKIFNDKRKEAFLNLTSKPYISPSFYNNFEDLSDISLFLLSSTCDMFLDDNICMAHKWKGPVKLNVHDELPHGFLMLRFLKDAQEGQETFFKLVKDALELKKRLPKLIQ